MNKNFRVIFSKTLGRLVVTSELAKGECKSSSGENRDVGDAKKEKRFSFTEGALVLFLITGMLGSTEVSYAAATGTSVKLEYNDSTAGNEESVSIGAFSASGTGNVLIGVSTVPNSENKGDLSIVIGNRTQLNGGNKLIAIGGNFGEVGTKNTTVIGNEIKLSDTTNDSIIVGSMLGGGVGVFADHKKAILLGNNINENVDQNGDDIEGKNAIVLGHDSMIGGENTVVIGSGVSAATNSGAIVIGAGIAGDIHKNSIILGKDSAGVEITKNSTAKYLKTGAENKDNEYGVMSIGASGKERRIVNLAGGTEDTDAVNVKQLEKVRSDLATKIGITYNNQTNDYDDPALVKLKDKTGTESATAVNDLVTAIKNNANKLNEGLVIGADNGGTKINYLGSTIEIKTADFSANNENYKTKNIETNIEQDATGKTTVKIGIKENPDFKSITFTDGGTNPYLTISKSGNGGSIAGLENRLPTTNGYGTGNNAGRVATEGAVKALYDKRTKYFSVNNGNDFMGASNNNNENNDGAKGSASISIGKGTQTLSVGSVFIGNRNNQDNVTTSDAMSGRGMYSTVVGTGNALHSAQRTEVDFLQTGVGALNNITGRGAISIGNLNNAWGNGVIAIGNNLEVNGGGTTAGFSGTSIGIVASEQLSPDDPTAIRGAKSQVLGQGNVGIGSQVHIGDNSGGNSNKPYKSVAIGYETTIKNLTLNAVAIGSSTMVEVSDSLALGSNSQVEKALIKNVSGYDISTNTNSTDASSTWRNNNGIVSFGQNDKTRRLTRVSAGVDDTDVVNVAQLKKVTLHILDDNQTTPNKFDVNLAADKLKFKHDTNENIKLELGSTDKSVAYTLNSTLKNITSITNNTGGVTNGTTVSIGNDGLTLNDKKITGLALGAVSDTSKDAITGKQLNPIATALGVTFNNTGAATGPTYSLKALKTGDAYDAGKTTKDYTKVGDALSALDNAIDNLKASQASSTIAYTANGVTTKKSVNLTDGFNFTNGKNTTAEVGDSGVVKFNLADSLTDLTSVATKEENGKKATISSETIKVEDTTNKTKTETTAAGVTISSTDATDKTKAELTKDSLKFTRDDNGTEKTLEINGNTGKITGLAAGEISETSTDAVNGSQLNNLLKKIDNKIEGNNSLVFVNDAGDELVKDGNKFYKKADLAGKVRANDGKYYNEADVNPDGSLKNQSATAATPAEQTPAYLSAINSDGTAGTATSIGNVKSALGLDNMPNTIGDGTTVTAIDKDKARKAIAGDNKDGKGGLLTKAGKDLYKVATAGDLQAVAAAGLTFTADETNKEIHRPLGTALKISTSNAIDDTTKANYTSANLGTKIDVNSNTISIEMKKALTGINAITSDENTDLVLAKGGTGKPKVTINDDGLKVTTGAAGAEKNITIGKDGKISGLADAELSDTSTDAVTGKQLHATNEKIKSLGDLAVQYDGAKKDSVTLGGGTAVRISNVAVATSSLGAKDPNFETVDFDGKVYDARDVDVSYEAKNPGDVLAQIGNDFYKLADLEEKQGKLGPKDNATKVAATDVVMVDGLTYAKDNVNVVGKKLKRGAIGRNLVKVGSDYYFASDLDNGNAKAGAVAVNKLAKDMDGKNAFDGLADLASGKDSSPITVNDAKRMGFVVAARNEDPQSKAGTYAEKVQNANKLEVVGGENIEVIGVTKGNTREIKVSMVGKPNFESIQLSHNKVNGAKLSTDADGDLHLSKGNTNDPVVIHGVADGLIAPDSDQAVNGGQLYDVKRDLKHTDRRLSAGVAGAYAMANLIHTRLPGERNVSVAGGYYKGQSAVALGFSATSDNGKITIRVSGTQNSSGDFGAGVGASYHW